jgi:hypothetical protein
VTVHLKTQWLALVGAQRLDARSESALLLETPEHLKDLVAMSS